jgi:hypothetical protein
MILEAAQAFLEIDANLGRVVDHLLMGHDVEIFQRRHTGDRMAVVGEPVREWRPRWSLVDQVAIDLLGDDASAEWHISAADTLGQR